jgi:hypothetical protein
MALWIGKNEREFFVFHVSKAGAFGELEKLGQNDCQA